MVESLCAFDEIMITKVTISELTINAGIVIVLTIAAIGVPDTGHPHYQITKKPPVGGFLLPVVLSWSPFRHPDHPVRVTTDDHQPGIVPVCRAAFSRGVQAIPSSGVMSDPVRRRMTMTIRSSVWVTVFSCVKGTHMTSVD